MSDFMLVDDVAGFKIEEYNGKFSLVAIRESNGKQYATWAKYKLGKDKYAEKDWPVKIELGDKEAAIKAAQFILEKMGVDCPF
jgi:hypothetical protein